MYDLFIIGAGPGGYTAAILGARKGLKVAIAEKGPFGGTCTNTGCIPTKAWCESAHLIEKIQNARKYGLSISDYTADMSGLNKRCQRITTRLGKGIEHLLKTGGVDIVNGEAAILDNETIAVGDQQFKARNIIIATGGAPQKPAIFDHQNVITSDEIFNLTEKPQSLIIVGGGVIGMEMAYIFSTLGTRVTVVEALERILATEDPEVSSALTRSLRKVEIISPARITSVTGSSDGIKAEAETATGTVTLQAKKMLLSIGRRPSLPQGIEHLDIQLNAAGGIKVDKTMHTGGIYAIGDATGEYTYAYTAAREAEVAIANITGEPAAMDYDTIPTVIFTSPEIASVGSVPPEMANIREGTFPVAALGRARTMEASDGFAKVITDSSGRLLRVSIMAPNATEMIAWATLAVKQGLNVKEFINPVYPHPVMSELLKEACEDVLGLSIHKP